MYDESSRSLSSPVREIININITNGLACGEEITAGSFLYAAHELLVLYGGHDVRITPAAM